MFRDGEEEKMEESMMKGKAVWSMKDKTQIEVVLERELKDKLRNLAKENERGLSNQILFMVKQQMKEEEENETK